MTLWTAPIFCAAMLCAAQALLLPSRSEARNLIINEVTVENKNKHDFVVVHEIADDDGRADAIQSIARARDRFWPGRDIIDATKTDDATLSERLKNGFTLYTTMGDKSKLFKAATQPLHLQIQDGTLRWNGVTAPTSELRVILVGKNPYGDGNCVVYAAGSSKLVSGINGCFHGPCSYHIFQGDKLLKEGFYGDDFTAAKDRLSQAEAIADVQQLFSTLQRVHPDLLAKVSLDDYTKLKKQTLDDIAKKLDSDASISLNDLAYTLCYAAAFFRDGHTSVWWRTQPDESNTLGVRFPGFLLDYDNGRFVAAASSNKNVEGLEILSVNGRPILEFLRPILDRCSGETLAWRALLFTGKQAFWYSFSSLCGSAQSLTLRLRDARGKESEQTVETLSFSDFQKLSQSVSAGRLKQLRRQGTQVRFYDSDSIAHFVYPAFIHSEDEKKKIESVFNEIKAKKSRDLIIDLRGNSGGSSSMGDIIFGHLRKAKLVNTSKTRIKVSSDILSPSYARFIKSAVGADAGGRYSAYLQKKYAGLEGVVLTQHGEDEGEGMIFADREKDEPVPGSSAFFSGRVFLLVDNGTFSSASMFAATFRDYNVGKILGYETGGLPISFGDVCGFELKNSGINCGVSWKQFFNAKPRPGDDEHGIIPDIPMTDKLLQPFQKEDDPVLAFTIDHIKKTGKGR